ncbi:MAG: ROK family protein [Anaerolineae bacterium]|jgi:glucokinase|nr:ROK family protein [Anaerolineae bacterium]
MSDVIIGVDLGGTNVRAARLNSDLHILQREQDATRSSEGFEATIQRIKDLIRRVLPADGAPVAGIGISAPGPLNPVTGVIVAPPNLAGWHNVPLGDILKAEFGVPVYVGNDANVAAIAEVALGAARGYRFAIYITISTGIGSGIIDEGRLILGKAGLGAEAGHLPLLLAGDHVSTLEKEAAGRALAKQARAFMEAGRASVLRAAMDSLSEKDWERRGATYIGEAAHQGDALALEIVQRCGTVVGLGLVSLLHLFNPEIIVIGGGVSRIGDLLFNRIQATVQAHALDSAYWENLKIVPAVLGDNVSIIGAAALVLTRGGSDDITTVIKALAD